MELNIEELTVRQIREIAAIAGCAKSTRKAAPFRERDVVVRSSGGVYFGRLIAMAGTYGRLANARHIRMWKSRPDHKAINCADIARFGAGPGTSITQPVPAELPTIYAVYDCTAEASAILTALPCA